MWRECTEAQLNARGTLASPAFPAQRHMKEEYMNEYREAFEMIAGHSLTAPLWGTLS